MADELLRAQYERYPYPERDPKDERTRLMPTGMDAFDRLNHYAWGGRRDLRNLRVLVAGGGTGDATVFIAEQIQTLIGEGPVNIVHIDLSKRSLEIAEARVRERCIEGVQFVHGSLLEMKDILPQLQAKDGQPLTEFDYINCSGVLHHLEDPEKGLCSLRDVLAPGGAIAIMLYGKYGRTGVYQFQELMRALPMEQAGPELRVNVCKAALEDLPETNWLMRQKEELLDLRTTDAELYDLLLHSRDRAYSVPEVYQFVQSSGLTVYDFVQLDGQAKRDYDPMTYFKKPKIRAMLEKLDPIKAKAVAELASGAMQKHTFYCGKSKPEHPSLNSGNLDEWIPNFAQALDVAGDAGPTLASHLQGREEKECKVVLGDVSISLEPTKYVRALLSVIDGHRTCRQVVDAARRALAGEVENVALEETLTQQLIETYKKCHYVDWMFLRAADGTLPAPRAQSMHEARETREASSL